MLFVRPKTSLSFAFGSLLLLLTDDVVGNTFVSVLITFLLPVEGGLEIDLLYQVGRCFDPDPMPLVLFTHMI